MGIPKQPKIRQQEQARATTTQGRIIRTRRQSKMMRWAQWPDGNFYKPEKEISRIEIEAITDDQWG